MWIDAMQICTWFLLMSFQIQGCKGEREVGAILCTFQSFSKLSFYLNTISDMIEGSSRAVLCACQSFSKLSFYLNTIIDMMELLIVYLFHQFSAGFCRSRKRETLAGVCCCRSKIAVMGSQIGQGKLSI
jgi:hypothetical protein